MDALRKREISLYAGVWALVFLLPVLLHAGHYFMGQDRFMHWADIPPAWMDILPYLILFCLHDLVVAPCFHRGKFVLYTLLALLLLTGFGIFCYSTGHRPPSAFDGPPGLPDGPMRPVHPETLRLVIGILVVLANLGVKAMFAAFRSERTVQELKAESLNRQLETLRYQINPHFFMNTLNNIHALVDVDPEKAKESIEAFSKLMRIVLYEGSGPTIPLRQEADYIRHYVSLMQLRYPESVPIRLSLPEQVPGAAVVPPLLMASFVENAFKHGISYEEPSFVDVSLGMEDGQIHFRCTNSVHQHTQRERHGMGTENIHKRLDLLYSGQYVLSEEENNGVFEIHLILPETC